MRKAPAVVLAIVSDATLASAAIGHAREARLSGLRRSKGALSRLFDALV
jgi:hypothetical protein